MSWFRVEARSVLWGACLFAAFACGGGSCDGCEECGVAPIPGGYPIADRIANSAQARLTRSGIQFIESNFGSIVTTFVPGGLDFPVPRSETGSGLTRATICSDDNCSAHIEIHSVDLTPTPPNALRLHLRVVVDSRDRSGPPGRRRAWPVRTSLATCNIDLDTRRGSRPFVGLAANVRFVAETQPARAGYTKLVVEDANLVMGESIEDADINISGCWVDWLLNLFRGTIIDQLEGQVSGMLRDELGEQLCTRRGEHGCPTGTFAVPDEDPDSVCRYGRDASSECVPILLGTDGQGDLGAAFLGGLSPGVHAPGQFVLAAGGDGEAVMDGMSLFMFGGFRSTDRTFRTSPAHHPCVPRIERPPLPTIPRAAAFRGNTIPGTSTEVHVGIGLSEQYLNHVGYGAFDAGLLCLGVGTRLSQQISTGLFSLLIPSLRALTFPQSAAPLSIALRPQRPPTFEIGPGTGTTAETALLVVRLDDLEVDFYVWSTERYVRFMTYRADLTIPVNLTVEDGALVPSIGEIVASESSVTNADMLQEDPAMLAEVIETVIGMFAGMVGGSIDPVELPELMGFELRVPEGGVRGVMSDGDEFLGIFANLALAMGPRPLTASVDTTARLDAVHVDPASLSLERFGRGRRPWVEVFARADGPAGADYEYAWRLDGTTWSPWQRSPYLRIEHPGLLLQARHVVEVRARVRDVDGTQDRSPARLEVLVDALAPEVRLEVEPGGVRVHAADVISDARALAWRWRIPGGAWSGWTEGADGALIAVGDGLREVEVEVRDEAGNTGSARAALIRGLPDPSAEGGCGSCAAETGQQTFATIGLLLGLGWLVRRRGSARGRGGRGRGQSRHGAWRSLVVLTLVLAASACDCGGTVSSNRDAGPVMCDPACDTGSLCCPTNGMCVAVDESTLCPTGMLCASGSATLDDRCMPTCTCMTPPPLDPGLLATYLDMTATSAGTLVLSGYSPGVPPTRPYGDLVVGRYEAGSMRVQWEIVDGAPSSPVTADPAGWRRGVSAPGDDVGRWTSVVESGGTLYVSYQDVTNTALKIAIGAPGRSWSIHTVDDRGDAGRYSSIVLTSTGAPAIAYMRVEPPAMGSTRPRGTVQVAVASSATPSGPTDWTLTEVHAVDVPCRAAWCPSGQVCLESGECATATMDCTPACESGRTCVRGRCEEIVGADWVEDMPVSTGLYNALARGPDGLALVFYDRTAGNLMGAREVGGRWQPPFLIDGYGRDEEFVGDCGIGASLFVDGSGRWHVSYVDGTEETLRYASIDGMRIDRETVDDGSTDGMSRHPDGRHIVGDDSSIVVTAAGEVRIVYQDATAQRAMLARRPAGGTWRIQILDREASTGYWLEQVLVGTTSHVATWWRDETTSPRRNGVRVLTVD
ncbi:MAG: hypothetical protein NZ898_10295 [Myxococcota bacterium]|nr:hypothetical protein [Myxococcota bacterium]